MKTRDQRFYTVDGKQKAEIDVDITHEREAPSIDRCRHAILHIKNKKQDGTDGHGYVIYDRLLCRIVNGVYYTSLEDVLECAQMYNDDPDSPQDMAPNGWALGLIYPDSNM